MGKQISSFIKFIYTMVLNIIPSRKSNYEVAYIMSFKQNDGGLIFKLFEKYGDRLIIFYTEDVWSEAKKFEDIGVHVKLYKAKNIILFFGELKTTPVIIVDNYFPELAALKKNQVIQIWHATGAIKKFGWEDLKNSQRTRMDRWRFQKVYDSFTDIVVGSDRMGEIFSQSYRIPKERIRYIGAPRSDQFQPSVSANIKNTKITYLYVPTYRETKEELKQVLEQALTVFTKAKEINFLIKLHPHDEKYFKLDVSKNVSFFSDSLGEAFSMVNGIITDYSSCVFDFHLQFPNKKIIFFCPDYSKYQINIGIQNDFCKEIETVATNKTMLLKEIKELGDPNKYKKYFQQWQGYNDGCASDRIMSLIESKGIEK